MQVTFRSLVVLVSHRGKTERLNWPKGFVKRSREKARHDLLHCFFLRFFPQKKLIFLGFRREAPSFFWGFSRLFLRFSDFGVWEVFFEVIFEVFGAKRRKPPKTVFLGGVGVLGGFVDFFLRFSGFGVLRVFFKFFLRFSVRRNFEGFFWGFAKTLKKTMRTGLLDKPCAAGARSVSRWNY